MSRSLHTDDGWSSVHDDQNNARVRAYLLSTCPERDYALTPSIPAYTESSFILFECVKALFECVEVHPTKISVLAKLLLS